MTSGGYALLYRAAPVPGPGGWTVVGWARTLREAEDEIASWPASAPRPSHGDIARVEGALDSATRGTYVFDDARGGFVTVGRRGSRAWRCADLWERRELPPYRAPHSDTVVNPWAMLDHCECLHWRTATLLLCDIVEALYGAAYPDNAFEALRLRSGLAPLRAYAHGRTTGPCMEQEVREAVAGLSPAYGVAAVGDGTLTGGLLGLAPRLAEGWRDMAEAVMRDDVVGADSNVEALREERWRRIVASVVPAIRARVPVSVISCRRLRIREPDGSLAWGDRDDTREDGVAPPRAAG